MHPRLLGPNQARLMKKVEQEKKNLFYIMRPAVSFVSTCVSKDGKRSKEFLRISIWGLQIWSTIVIKASTKSNEMKFIISTNLYGSLRFEFFDQVASKPPDQT